MTSDPVLTPSIDMSFNIKFWCTITFTAPTFNNVDFAILGSYYAKRTIAVGAFNFEPAQCVSTYTVGVTASPIASFVTLIGNNIEIDTTDPSKIGNYQVTVTAFP